MDLESLITKIPEGQRTLLELTGDDKGNRKVEFSLRRELPPEPREPKRAESPRRAHTFLTAKSFADYLAKYGTADTVVYADPSGELVSAVLNEKAEEGFEIVHMKPDSHPLWKPWEEIAGERKAIRDFAAFVMEHRRSISKPDGKGVALDFSQVRASVKTEIHEGRGPSAINGIVVTTELQGKRSDKLVQLPDEIALNVPLYVGTSKREIVADLTLEASPGGAVTVLVSMGSVAEARIAAFEEMVEIISKALAGKGATLTLGRPAHAPWTYLPELAPKASS